MTRGNQREVARNKNMKKQAEQLRKKPSGGDGLTLVQRKQRDAELMREKQKKKADEATTTSNGSNKDAERKKEEEATTTSNGSNK